MNVHIGTSFLFQVPITHEDYRESHPDEQRYVKMFQAIDMSSNFYFSYSYDLTNTVQYNMERPAYITTDSKTRRLDSVFKDSGAASTAAYVSKPNSRYLWNEFLTEEMRGTVNVDWFLNIIHGFVDQANISIYGTPILLTLIARRSNRFAGTRFLKRGANFKGDVANEVETEQIVADSSVSSFDKANITSFVQMRGSVPGHWAQDTTTMVPKPQIFFQRPDPHSKTAAKHFNQVKVAYASENHLF